MPKQKTQIFFIHGGDTFKNRNKYLHFLKHRTISVAKKIKWNAAYLNQKLRADFDIIRPRMPLQDNAKYSDWAIHFEKYFLSLKTILF